MLADPKLIQYTKKFLETVNLECGLPKDYKSYFRIDPGIYASTLNFHLEIENYDYNYDNPLSFPFYEDSNEGLFPTHNLNQYGVADNLEQILELSNVQKYIIDSPDPFCLSITPIWKEDQPKRDGWRWHKWGEYIGTQNPHHEYLYDEEDIWLVYVYHIYKLKAEQVDNNV